MDRGSHDYQAARHYSSAGLRRNEVWERLRDGRRAHSRGWSGGQRDWSMIVVRASGRASTTRHQSVPNGAPERPLENVVGDIKPQLFAQLTSRCRIRGYSANIAKSRDKLSLYFLVAHTSAPKVRRSLPAWMEWDAPSATKEPRFSARSFCCGLDR